MGPVAASFTGLSLNELEKEMVYIKINYMALNPNKPSRNNISNKDNITADVVLKMRLNIIMILT